MAKRGQSKYMPHLRAKQATTQAFVRPRGPGQEMERDFRSGPDVRGIKNQYGVIRTEEELKTKGKYGGLCNRSACLRHEAYWWNRGSRAYYCEDCAHLINKEFRHRDDVENYGSLLVQPPLDVDIVDLGAIYGDIEVRELWNDKHPKPWCIEYSNGDKVYFDTEEEAAAAQRHFRHVTGLRNDGSTPLWFKELSERYQKLREMVTVKNNW